MRARKFESGLLVLIAVLAQSVLVQSVAMADSAATTRRATTELRTAQVHPTPHPPAQASAQTAPHGESLQFAGLSPTADVRAATLDAAPADRSTTKDLLALILVGVMLVAYQLFRKHRLLRQQPFSL
jgi:hypothetical protein